MFEQQQIFQCQFDIVDAGNSIDGFPVTINIMSQSISWTPVFWDSETDVSLSGKKRSNIRGYDVNINLDYDRMLEPDKLKTLLDGLIQAKSNSVEVRFAPDASDPSTYFTVVPTESITRKMDYEDTIKKGESPNLSFESDSIIGQTDTPSSSPSVGDADTLDGLDATQFLRSDVDDSFNGDHIDFNSTVGISDNLTMYSNRITSVATPQDNSDVATKGYVDNAIDGLDWQESVLDEINDPSGLSPNTGDRYLVGENPVGDFSGQAENIAEWDGTQWTFEIPDEGFTLEIESNGYIWIFNGNTWVRFGSAISHNQLKDLDASDHMGQTLDNGVAVYNAGTDKFDSKNLADLIGGTTNQISVGDDGDGTVTLSAPQDLHTQADFGVNLLDFDDKVSTRDFASGSLGEGAIVDNTTPRGSLIEADNIRVRSTLRTHVFKKDIIRASNSLLYVTDASEIVSPVTTPSTTSTSFTITVKQGVFTSGDTVKYKDINEDDGNIYEVVADITDNGTSTTVNGQNVVEYTASLTSGTDVSLKAGDTVVRTSGGTILLDASSANSPFIDILQNGDVKQRSGNLNGITDTVNGEDVQGYGLYSDNAFLKGGIVATFGALGGWDINSTTISGGNIVIDSNGEIRNTTLVNSVPAWKLANDGSGHLAGGNIDWLSDGTTSITAEVTIETGSSGIVNFSDAGGLASKDSVGNAEIDDDAVSDAKVDDTIISGGLIITSLLSADNIETGTLTSQNNNVVFDLDNGTFNADNFDLNAGSGNVVLDSGSGISLNSGTINFNLDGSGQLASGNISWDDVGNASFEGTITVDDGEIGNWTINTTSLVSPEGSTAEIRLLEGGDSRVTMGAEATLPSTVPTSYTHSPSSAFVNVTGGATDNDTTGHFDDGGGGYNPNKQIEMDINITDNSASGTGRWEYIVQGYDGTNWVNIEDSGGSGTGDYSTTSYVSLVGYDDGRIRLTVSGTKPEDDISVSLSVDIAQYQAETVINKYGVFARLSPNTVKALGDSGGSELAVPVTTVFGSTGDITVNEIPLGANMYIDGSGNLSATDSNTTYSAGSHLSLSGTTFSVNDGGSSSLTAGFLGELTSYGAGDGRGLEFPDYDDGSGGYSRIYFDESTNELRFYTRDSSDNTVGMELRVRDNSEFRTVYHTGNLSRSDLGLGSSDTPTFDSVEAGSGIRIGDGFGNGGTATIHKQNGLYLQYNTGNSTDELRIGGGGTSVDILEYENGDYKLGKNGTNSHINGNGSDFFGVGTTSPDSRLAVNNSSSYTYPARHIGFAIDNDTKASIGFNPSNNQILFGSSWNPASGTVLALDIDDNSATVTGTITWNSDRRLKSEIDPIANPVEKLMATKGRQYFRDDKDGKFEHGFIAQELYKVFPDAVKTPEDGMWSVSDVAVTATLVEGFKNHEQRIRELEQENEELKAKLDEVA